MQVNQDLDFKTYKKSLERDRFVDVSQEAIKLTDNHLLSACNGTGTVLGTGDSKIIIKLSLSLRLYNHYQQLLTGSNQIK